MVDTANLGKNDIDGISVETAVAAAQVAYDAGRKITATDLLRTGSEGLDCEVSDSEESETVAEGLGEEDGEEQLGFDRELGDTEGYAAF